MAENDIVVGTLKKGGNDFYPRTSKELVAGMPSALSDLTADSTHRTVTDTEKATWNEKYTKPDTGIPASDLAPGAVPQEIFWATYGTTTRAEVISAVESGKIVCVYYNNEVFISANINTAEGNTNNFYFACLDNGQLKSVYLQQNGTWGGPIGFTAENSSNKTGDIESNKTSTTKYPTTKGVADYVASKELSDLADVSDTAPTNGQALLWDGTNEEWKPGTVQGGGGSVTDVTVGGTSVVNQQGVAEVPAIPETVQAQEIEIDSAPTSNSQNLVTSGGVASALAEKYEKPSGGIPSTDLAADAVPVIPVDTAIPSGGLDANVHYDLGTLTGSVSITLDATSAVSGLLNIYSLSFTAGSTAPTITWPSSITNWAGNCLDATTMAPVITGGNSYEVSIRGGLAVITEFVAS